MSLRALRPIARATSAAVARPALSARIAIPSVARASIAASRSIPVAVRGFSVSARRLGSGENDDALSAVVAAELQYELDEASGSPDVPEFIEAFNAQGTWDIKDIPGAEDVVLTRKFGNETLELTFQVSEVDPSPLAELADADASAEGAEVDGADAAPIVTCSLVISKDKHPLAMSVDLDAQDTGLIITNVAMFERSVALEKGSEGDWARRERYLGPQFEHLDGGVQDAFVAYLAERGVDDALATFILAYAEHKEQTDYLDWLSQVKGFVNH